MGCGHKIVLGEHMSCGKTSFSGVYVFQDDMGTFVLREVMLCRTCIMVGYMSTCL